MTRPHRHSVAGVRLWTPCPGARQHRADVFILSRCAAMEAYSMSPPWESKPQVTEVLKEYKGSSPMYDLNEILKEQMSLPLDVTFRDLQAQYRLEGHSIYSHVKFIHPLLGTMWLSASGTMEMTDRSMDIVFERFWVDRGNLRENIDEPGSTDATQEQWDRIISWMGRLGFIRPLAVFPVLYLDEDMCVFRFPPLSSNIAVTKL